MKTRMGLFLILMLLGHKKGQSQAIDTLIRVDNHRLHFKVIKGNDIPIVFEAGNGSDGSVWEPLLQGLHKFTGATLITYDRAGLDKSEIDTNTISFDREVKNLGAVLKNLVIIKNISWWPIHSAGFMPLNLHKETRVK